MDQGDDLVVPSSADDEARAAPIVAKLASVIGGLATSAGFLSPARLETAMSVAEAVGKLVGEPSLTRVLALRALTSPPRLRLAIADIRTAAVSLPVTIRAAIMHELALMIDGDANLLAIGVTSDLADALSVHLPENLSPDSRGVFSTLESLAERAKRLVRTETLRIAEAQRFAVDFGETQLLKAVETARHDADEKVLLRPLGLAIDSVRQRIAALSRLIETQAEALSIAQQLDAAADQIERIARQRYASITRRASMLKRHIREDLNALAEDAAEEFEVDFRRLAESRSGWFGKFDTADLNDRLVVKNLDRRYQNLTRRYQDQLDLLSMEVSEYCDEFVRAGDDALRPMARHAFRTIAPHPSFELRLKAAVDRASTRTLLGGAAGVAASGTAIHFGLMSAAVATGPVGAAVLGAVALAGVWKVFANPGERRRRDPRERGQALENKLREEIMANLPKFDQAIDIIVTHFRDIVVPDIARPRLEAECIREIVAAHRDVSGRVIDAAKARINRLVRTFEVT